VAKKLAFFKKHHCPAKTPSPYCPIQIFMFGGQWLYGEVL
jgi:hypothetical protein